MTVYESLVTASKAADCKAQSMYVPTDGRHGSGKRVWKTFPVLPRWEGGIESIVMDEQVTHDVLLNTSQTVGMSVGIGGRREPGRLRPLYLGLPRGGPEGRKRSLRRYLRRGRAQPGKAGPGNARPRRNPGGRASEGVFLLIHPTPAQMMTK